MAGGVRNASAKPALRRTLRAASSTSAQLTPAATAAIAGLLRFQHRLVGVPLLGLGLAQADGARHIGAVTFEDNTEVQVRNPRFGSGAAVARPCGRAERSPGGDDGFKRHSLGAQRRAWCSSSAATSISAMPGRMKAQNVLEELAAHQRRLAISASSSSSFTSAGARQRRGQCLKERAAQPGGQFGFPAGQIRPLSSRRVESGKIHARLRGQPLRRGHRGRAGDNLDLRRLHLFRGLLL